MFAKHAIGCAHQINCMFTVDNHITLKTEALEKFSLGFGTSLSHRNNSFWLDRINCCLELLNLNFNKFALALNFKVELVLSELDLILVLLLNQLEVSLLLDLS